MELIEYIIFGVLGVLVLTSWWFWVRVPEPSSDYAVKFWGENSRYFEILLQLNVAGMALAIGSYIWGINWDGKHGVISLIIFALLATTRDSLKKRDATKKIPAPVAKL